MALEAQLAEQKDLEEELRLRVEELQADIDEQEADEEEMVTQFEKSIAELKSEVAARGKLTEQSSSSEHGAPTTSTAPARMASLAVAAMEEEEKAGLVPHLPPLLRL